MRVQADFAWKYPALAGNRSSNARRAATAGSPGGSCIVTQDHRRTPHSSTEFERSTMDRVMSTMSVHSVAGNTQQLDGGAMFGNCPRRRLGEVGPPDEKNRITLACRAMLVKESDRNVLLEAGIGAFFEPKIGAFRCRRKSRPRARASRSRSWAAPPTSTSSCSRISISIMQAASEPGTRPASTRARFPNACYVVGERAWERARPRTRAIERPSSRRSKRSSRRPAGWRRWRTRRSRRRHVRAERDAPLPVRVVRRAHARPLLGTVLDTPRGPVTFLGISCRASRGSISRSRWDTTAILSV